MAALAYPGTSLREQGAGVRGMAMSEAKVEAAELQGAGMLEARDLAVGYREGIDILQGLSLSVVPGAITTIIGPNGAGKSTLLKCLFGLLPARVGEVQFE